MLVPGPLFRQCVTRLLLVTLSLVFTASCGDDGGDGLSSMPVIDVMSSSGGTMSTPTNCASLVPLRAYQSTPSAIALLFRVEDCDSGDAIPDLDRDVTNNFEILENDETISSEAHRDVLPSRGQRVYISVLLDMSDSTQSIRPQLVAAAKNFVDALLSNDTLNPKVRIGVGIFDGRDALVTQLTPTNDITALNATLDALESFSDPMADGGATNLNGALRQSVEGLLNHQRQVLTNSLDGVVTTGYVLAFTDGADSAGRETAEGATTTIAEARTTTLASQDPIVQTYAIALKSDDYEQLQGREALLGLVGDERFLAEADDAASLANTFADVATRITTQLQSTYLLAYCSAKRSGQHTVSLRISRSVYPRSRPLTHTFNADGFGGGCNADFFNRACNTNTCGGFNCGACDDNTTCVDTNGTFQCQ